MKTLWSTDGTQTRFVLTELPAELQQAARGLGFEPFEEGFARAYPADAPGLDRIYRQFADHAEEMLRQKAGSVPVPWERTLLAFLEIVEGRELDWWLCGSAALAVRGLAVSPNDVDLNVTEPSALRLGELLGDCLVEPVQRARGWFCAWWGRAFLHGRIEWVGGVNETADQPEAGDFGPAAESRLEIVDWHGHSIRVPPLDLQLRVSERRGLMDRAALIRGAIRS